MIGLWKVKPTV